MQVFVVGGFVRDTLLGRHPKDHDFVVVGATPQEMLDLGFQQVGADFPVFLHPHSNDEWALARKERKVGDGYHGFECEFDTSVTLEDDLFRRDLTVNAMAMPVLEWFDDGQVVIDQNTIIDPFNGQNDLDERMLRHVSEHFVEDPVRVLRIARFSARYGFLVADETFQLMDQMALDGELDHLVPERVWAELDKAIMEVWPHRFFHILDASEAMKTVFPELTRVHRFWEIAAGQNSLERFAILALLMGGGHAHSFFNRLKAPSDVINFVFKFTLAMDWWADDRELTAGDKLHFLKTHDCFRDREFLPKAVETASRLATLGERRHFVLHAFLMAQDIALTVGFDDLTEDQRATLKGPAVGAAIDQLRLEAIQELDTPAK